MTTLFSFSNAWRITSQVNDDNKNDYLNKLAQYRFVTTVSEEIQHFLEGLNMYLIIKDI